MFGELPAAHQAFFAETLDVWALVRKHLSVRGVQTGLAGTLA